MSCIDLDLDVNSEARVLNKEGRINGGNVFFGVSIT